MKSVSILIALTLSMFSFGQADTIDPKMLEFEYDSCDVAVWKIHFKDNSDNWNDSIYPSRKLAHSSLSKSQSEEVLKALMDSSSYDGIRANLTHHDIVIRFYHSGKVASNIEISAMTGNVNIDNSSNGYYVRNNCSKSFGRSLVELLNELGMIELTGYDEIDLEGLIHPW